MNRAFLTRTLLLLLALVTLVGSGCRTASSAGYKATDPMIANQGDISSNRD